MNILCTICSDLINQTENLFVTTCGHLFHHQCLAQWIERSRSCPQCRNKVTERCMFRIFPTSCEGPAGGESAAALQARLDDANLQLRQRDAAERDLHKRLEELDNNVKHQRERAKQFELRAEKGEAAVSALREQLKCVRALADEADALRAHNEELRTQIDLLHGLQRVLSAAADDVDKMLGAYSDLRTVATFATALKRALCDSETKKNESRDEVRALRTQLAAERQRTARLRRTLRVQKNRIEKESILSTSVDDSTRAECGDAASKHCGGGEDSPFVSSGGADVSLKTLVKNIEAADSPYLDLDRGSVALALLPRRGERPAPPAAAPPRPPVAVQTYSIFKGGGQATGSGLFGAMEAARSRLDTSYDGLGGHSKKDEFPTALRRPRVPAHAAFRRRLLTDTKRRRRDAL